jgi:hypothetical protein
MKVRELVEMLKDLDQEAMVAVSGYEGGYSEASSVEGVTLVLNANTEHYYGPHEIDSDTLYRGEQLKAHERAKAYILS